MIYTFLTKKAMKLAYAAHHGQTDKSGVPYIFHPIHLAEQMEDEATTIAALLHDLIEDSDYTLDDLRAEGFPQPVLDALDLLTHTKGTPYLDYIKSLRNNYIAATVKRADLRHNIDLTRLGIVDEQTLKRIEKYQNALKILENENNG